jgi:hypothetical protein
MIVVGTTNSPLSMKWYIKFGLNESPLLNPTIFTPASTEWAKEISIGISGRYLSVVKNPGDGDL